MLVSTNWLQQYIDVKDKDKLQLAEDITKTGIEVEQVMDPVLQSDKLVVGYVEACDQHPNADKLNVCQVNVGETDLAQIICGANNVAKGQYVIVAKPGARLPGGLKIKKAKLRGEVSEGMICSLNELGVDDKFLTEADKEGIFVIEEPVEVGQLAAPLLNLDDTIIEFDLTPNRADCLSMLGMAYETAAIYDQKVQLPEPQVTKAEEASSNHISVQLDNQQANPFYGAWILKDIEVKQSPQWLKNRLMSAGIRPINNVVDVTNYVLLEYGQPLHAFDYQRFGSKEVVTRLANEGETIKTLDGEERTLQTDHLVITNGKEAHAIAGVMGGEKSEVQDDTTMILLEAASFDPASIRKASKDHGIRSEASVRYEKGLDQTRVRDAATRAAQLLQEVAGATVLGDMVEQGSLEVEPQHITFSRPEMEMRIGASISMEEMYQIFNRLGFEAKNQDELITVTIPPRRGDVLRKEDMVEEIARIYGYDRIPYTLPTGEMHPGGLSKRQKALRKAHDYLQSTGLNEAITYSLTTEKNAYKFVSPEVKNMEANAVPLAMPMTDLHSHLRLSAVPELLQSVRYNVARNQYNIALYEIGPIYPQTKGEGTQPEEKLRTTGAITGLWINHPWQAQKQPVDFFILKGIVEGLLSHFAVPEVAYEQAELDGMHPGRTAIVKSGERVIGYLGQLHPTTQKDYDLSETYVYDLDLEAILELSDQEERYEKITKYPAISQDLAFVVNDNVTASELEKVIQEAGQPHLQSILVFDVYDGEHMEAGKKSVAFNLVFQNSERTLKDEEIEEARKSIVEQVEKVYEAELRG
ncbi:phenylalanine--tRNA ligase subunit beta [Halalkalibacillus halophilus]|uniref:phenylalanine--tRNA ligase subunit beta n=1 Tax=Halalkalibacillus halophilus TaxID=392827 RepID=UPI000404BD58|nr:phenylalanine--tRNA ligase subunit beta [Halalkalibacillus halophilus]